METVLCVLHDEDMMEKLVCLQNEVYQERGLHFNKDFFQHLFIDNPDGQAISCNAFDGGRMIAHISLEPEKMLVNGHVVKCMREMSVVTHPDYRGNGLLSSLTNMAIEEAAKQGYAFVYGLANGNSFPAFVRHCGFSFITRLNVMMGFGTEICEDGKKTYRRYWSEDALAWRFSQGKYRKVGNCVLGQFRTGVETYMGTLPSQSQVQISDNNNYKPFLPQVKLYVGLGAKLPWSYFKVPKFIKHSPFNLIFRDLTGGNLPMMTKDNLYYQLMDFDVA